MWIVRIALRRPYTFVVMALLILMLGPLTIARTPTDIFPNIDIPVVTVVWNYGGLSADEMSNRIVSIYERNLTATVNDIEHVESQSLRGIAVVKVFFQPGAKIDLAVAQVTASAQSQLRQLPPGTQPPFILTYNASTVPVLQLALSGKKLSEQQLFDIAVNFLRTQLAGVSGAQIPYPYGGKQPQIQVDLLPGAMQAKHLTPADVVNAISVQNLILPGGTQKLGTTEYDVDMNASPKTIEELNDLPIRTVAGNTIYIHDVAHVRDGFPPQTNIVRVDGSRAALLTIQKVGNASTIDIINNVKNLLPKIAAGLPPELEIKPLADQSVFVQASISGVLREALIAACLTALMILVFLGSWRSTVIIAVSIPLSILSSIIVLSALGETINIMTLGGLALAVGMLVDDATVAIENINWHLEQGKDLEPAILEGSDQIAIPAFVSTICICIVFVPMFFLTGVARYLFVPMAEAVVFAMLASYVLSRTLVPTMAKYLLHAHEPHGEGRPSRNPLVILQRAIDRGFVRMRNGYRALLEQCVGSRRIFTALFLGGCIASLFLARWVGEDFFPAVDGGQFKLHLRASSGTRIEETAILADHVEDALREIIPAGELAGIIDNIGLPYSGLNLSYSTSAPIGPGDADIMVSLGQGHRPTAEYIHDLRMSLPQTVSRRHLLVRPGRHRHADSEFRTARPDRHPDRRPQHPGEPRVRGPAGDQARAGARHRRSAGPAGVQPAAPAPGRRPHARRSARPDPARRRHQPVDLALGQQPDHADLVAEPEHRSQLRRRHPDAAVPGRLAAGSRQHSDHRRRSRPDAAGAGDGHPRCRHPGLVALQRRAGDRHLRRRAGTRSGQRRARHQPDSRRGSEGAAARLADHRARADRHDDDLVHRPAGRAGAWRSCWCIC